MATKTGFQSYFSRNVGATDADLSIGNSSTGVDRLYVYSGATVIGQAAAADAMTLGRPYVVAVTHAASGAGIGYIDGRQVLSGTATPAGAGVTSLRLLNNELNEEPNHEMWDLRIWQAVLSREELQKEQDSPHPLRLADLWGHWPLHNERDLRDYSGNGRDFTMTGTLVATPSIYGLTLPHDVHILGLATGGGATTYNQSVAGTLTSAGAAAKRANLVKAGTLTSAGTLARRTNAVKAGTLTTAGVVAKRANKPLAGTLTNSGALVAAKVAVLALTGTLTAAGALVRRTGKSLAATLTTAGSAAKQTNKPLAGTLTSAGTLARVKVAVLALSGTLTSAGAIARRTNTGLAGTLTTGGALVKAVSRSLAGTLTTAGALAKLVARRLTGTLTSAGTLTPEAIEIVSLPEVSGALVLPAHLAPGEARAAIMSNGGARAIVMSTGGATPVQRRVG